MLAVCTLQEEMTLFHSIAKVIALHLHLDYGDVIQKKSFTAYTYTLAMAHQHLVRQINRSCSVIYFMQ